MAKIPGKFDRLLVLRTGLFFAVSVFLLFCVSKHVPWRDEYQTFLVSTRTKGWSEFWTATRYERTPPLHYLLQRFLWPLFQGAIEPRTFIRLLTIPFSLLTFFLFFFRFDFDPLLAFLLALNVYFFREWGVLSRSYTIGGGLLFLSLAVRKRGKIDLARVLLALAGATHLLFFLVSGPLLALDYFDEYRKYGFRVRSRSFWISAIFVGAVLGTVALHAIPPPDSEFVTGISWPTTLRGIIRWVSETFRFISATLLPIEMTDRSGVLDFTWAWNQSPIRMGWTFLFAIPLWRIFRRDPKLFVRLGVVVTPVLCIFVGAYGPALRHTAVLFAVLVYFMAQVETSRRDRWAAYALAIGPWIAGMFWLVAWNPFTPRFSFSDAPALVPIVRDAGTIYATRDFTLFATMAESGRSIFDVKRNRTVIYPSFRLPVEYHPMEEFCAHPERYPLRVGDVFVFPLDQTGEAARLQDHCGDWAPVYESRGTFVTDESFRVYRYRGAGAG